MKHNIIILFISISYFVAAGQEPKSTSKGQKDPVCGMKVTKKAQYASVYKETEHKFCSKVCKNKFDAAPAKYVKK